MAKKTHRLRFDAYQVGDRLLDGVNFGVFVEVDGNSATIGAVEPWDEGDASYLQRINMDHFTPLAIASLQRNIDALTKIYADEGTTVEKEVAQWEIEYDEPGIQVLLEY